MQFSKLTLVNSKKVKRPLEFFFPEYIYLYSQTILVISLTTKNLAENKYQSTMKI